jgi:hypothetical protein
LLQLKQVASGSVPSLTASIPVRFNNTLFWGCGEKDCEYESVSSSSNFNFPVVFVCVFFRLFFYICSLHVI